MFEELVHPVTPSIESCGYFCCYLSKDWIICLWGLWLHLNTMEANEDFVSSWPVSMFKKKLQYGCSPVFHLFVFYFKSILVLCYYTNTNPIFLIVYDALWGLQVKDCQSARMNSVYYSFVLVFRVLVFIFICNN